MSCLLEVGKDVVLSDSDAVWFKDPIKEIDELEGDVLGSRVGWPAPLGDPENGVTLCMGFIIFRAGGKGMPAFQRVLQESMMEKPDDQVRWLLTTWLGYDQLVDSKAHYCCATYYSAIQLDV